MAVSNTLAPKQTKTSFTAYLSNDAAKDRINKVIGGKDGQRFITAIISAVNTNPALQECTNASILSGALLGESLKLSPSPQLAHYYLVPYNDKERGKVAQFQLGYKGYIQLAIRSGQYKTLNVLPIKEGELVKYDPLNEEIEVNLIDDEEARENAKTIGYYASFSYLNGFKKAIYWSRAKMESHAMRYSPGYKNDKSKGTKYTFWSKDFDGMACKTMLRQLISKWGIMSIDMQQAFEGDMAVINDDGSKSYVETEEIIEAPVTAPEPEEQPKAEKAVKPTAKAEKPENKPTGAQGGEGATAEEILFS